MYTGGVHLTIDVKKRSSKNLQNVKKRKKRDKNKKNVCKRSIKNVTYTSLCLTLNV